MRLFVFWITALFALLTGCASENPNEEEQFDFSPFTYVENIHFTTTMNELSAVLPNNKREFLIAGEDGVRYEFEKEGVYHQVTALFYGADFFNTLIIELDFSMKESVIESVFAFLQDVLNKRFNQPVSQESTADDETVTWMEETLDKTLSFNINLKKFDRTIILEYFVIELQNSDDAESL